MTFHPQTPFCSNHLHERLISFLAHLDLLPLSEQADAFVNEVIEAGAIWKAIETEPGDCALKIDLHDICVVGRSEAAAMILWKAKARGQLAERQASDDLTLTYSLCGSPRNTAEEILNAREAEERQRAQS